MAKTTQGPWEWRGNQLYSVGEKSTLLKDVVFWNQDPGDKALIAAAPDMLAALNASRLYVETLEKHLDPVTDPAAPTIREHAAMVRAAIAKATVT